MKKIYRYLLRGLLAIAVIATGVVSYGIWQIAYHLPDQDPTPLPPELIDLHSPQGEALLSTSTYRADYASLNENFEGQSRMAYCGVASSVIVLNALNTDQQHKQQLPVTQKSFFTDKVREVMTPTAVAFGGMTLDQNGELLRAHGLETTVTHAADSTLENFRTLVQQNLATTGDYLLVNYSRKPLGEDGGGHFSPLGAYDANTDKVLIMDVTDYNYPPTWVPLNMLWQAMNTIDSASGKTRGFVVVRKL